MTHDRFCACAPCSLARMQDPETDRDSQRIMIDRWASIEGLLSDSERVTSNDRDTRDPQ